MYLILDYTCPATIRNQSRITIAPTACTSRKRCLRSAVNGKITFMKIAATFTDPTVAAIGLRNVANLLINYAHFRNSSLAELTAPHKIIETEFHFYTVWQDVQINQKLNLHTVISALPVDNAQSLPLKAEFRHKVLATHFTNKINIKFRHTIHLITYSYLQANFAIITHIRPGN
ncbi:hypothetical protein [Burkholderia ubonensis]|uniref:hypothetical protein n=1 Tax=Burkholderia ubonensis TaxID=101571 RepID=UPI0012FAF1B3|nr:hypothetical protein [Burkholderia ubonensis]